MSFYSFFNKFRLSLPCPLSLGEKRQKSGTKRSRRQKDSRGDQKHGQPLHNKDRDPLWFCNFYPLSSIFPKAAREEQVRTRPFAHKKTPARITPNWGLLKGRVGKARCADKVKEKVFMGWGTIPNFCSFQTLGQFNKMTKSCQEVF